ncbi:X-domain of DnaJ-containing-domain-containing protein [Lactarius hengduanensis]|nr:X-domain of DnaJ-containing-domain-containing protein [Lactarius hengduanensis]
MTTCPSCSIRLRGISQCDYVAVAEGELSVKEDQSLLVFGPEEDGWLLVQDKDDGKVGYVPGNYIKAVDDAGSTTAVPATPHIVVSDSPYRRQERKRKEKERRKREGREREREDHAQREKEREDEEAGEETRRVADDKREAKSATRTVRSPKPEGRKSVEKRPPPDPSQTREWRDRTGQFRVEAAFLGYKNGVLRLHKKIAAEDMRYVEKINGRGGSVSRKSGDDDDDDDEPLAKRRQSLHTVPAPTKKAPPVDWFEFFLKAGCGMDDCTRYASSFERDKIALSILPDITEGTLRTLGLREGDIIRVAKVIEPPSKAPRESSVLRDSTHDDHRNPPVCHPLRRPNWHLPALVACWRRPSQTFFDQLARLSQLRVQTPAAAAPKSASPAPSPGITSPLAMSGCNPGLGASHAPPLGPYPPDRATFPIRRARFRAYAPCDLTVIPGYTFLAVTRATAHGLPVLPSPSADGFPVKPYPATDGFPAKSCPAVDGFPAVAGAAAYRGGPAGRRAARARHFRMGRSVGYSLSDEAARPLSSYATPSQDALAPSPSTPLLQTSVAAGSASAPATPVSPNPKKRSKMTPEQREKLVAHERERKRALEVRVRTLTDKLTERLRPFVGAKNPGGPGDPETAVWEARMRREADDLKLEITQGTRPGFWSKLKEKGAVAKDAWGVIGSALSVQQVMQDIERAQLKGDVGDEELKALEIDVTGKIMLASWRGTRFEVVQVLREVNVVLKDHIANNQELYHRTRGLLLLGAIFKSTVPDESDEERRELERMVAEVAKPKKKQAPPSAAAQAGAKTAHDVRHGHANGHWHTSPAATDAKFTDAKSSF